MANARIVRRFETRCSWRLAALASSSSAETEDALSVPSACVTRASRAVVRDRYPDEISGSIPSVKPPYPAGFEKGSIPTASCGMSDPSSAFMASTNAANATVLEAGIRIVGGGNERSDRVAM